MKDEVDRNAPTVCSNNGTPAVSEPGVGRGRED